MIKIGYLYGAAKSSIINDINLAIEYSTRRGIIPDTIELHPFYEVSKFGDMKVIVTKKMPVGQVFVGKEE